LYKDLANPIYVIIAQDVSECKVLGSVTFGEKVSLGVSLGGKVNISKKVMRLVSTLQSILSPVVREKGMKEQIIAESLPRLYIIR
jgi:hypothetical protein